MVVYKGIKRFRTSRRGRLAPAWMLVAIWLWLPLATQAADNKIAFHQIRRQIFDSCVWTNSAPVRVIVADRGKIYRQGPADVPLWTPIESGVQETLFSVHFIDKRNGWISGAGGTILKSDDGGATWNRQVSNVRNHLFSIHFADEFHGCAVGDWGAIVVTDSGGRTWQNVAWTEDIVFYGVHMLDAENGLIVGEFGKILITADGGRTWTESAAIVDQSLFCLDASGQTVVAAGLDGILLVSDDRGKTWQVVDSPLKASIYGISINGRSVRAVGDAGVLLQSDDGGHTWISVPGGKNPSLAWDRRGSSLLAPERPHPDADSVTGP